MDKITIRSATLKDLPILRNFEQGVIAAERPLDPTLAANPITYYDLKELILAKDASVVVAECASEIIASGYAKIKPARHYLDHDVYGYLGFMYTLPGYRGKGINKMIIEALVHWCSAQGVQEIRLTVYEENIGAINAYEKAGFQKHMIEMRMRQ